MISDTHETMGDLQLIKDHYVKTSCTTQVFLDYMLYKKCAEIMGAEVIGYKFWLDMNPTLRYRYIVVYRDALSYHEPSYPYQITREAAKRFGE